MSTFDVEQFSCRAEAFEASENQSSNPSDTPTLGDVINRRYGRRDVLRGALAVGAVSALAGSLGLLDARKALAAQPSFQFAEIVHGVDETHHVAPGYEAEILIRWGDPVVPGAPAFDPMNQSADAQEMQFGYNNDFVGYVGLPLGSDNPDHGLLCINHEYTSEEVMFPGIGQLEKDKTFAYMTAGLVGIEMAAHGGSIIEVKRENGKWQVVPDSSYARRISLRSTEMSATGPAAGHDRLKTSADPEGRKIVGTVNNCAGGITPWGTYLMAEENFNDYFMGNLEGHPEARNYERYGLPGGWYGWARFDKRFDINAEPNEGNRFGWVVEVDPLDPASTPRKHTALGRFKHEGASSIVNKDGRIVVYMGDDERFDYLYKFVSEGRYDPANRAANLRLLESGTLYAARFDEGGQATWLPLVFGTGSLTAENDFHSQADVLIETRRAADLLGATAMDRPEDVDPNPVTNRVYVMLTHNTKRKASDENPANPRADNAFGHIVELTPPDGDHAATTTAWDILVKCGDPKLAEVGAAWNPATSENGWFAAPDNCAVDARGRLWVTTDQGSGWSKSGTADGVWALETDGDLRGTGRMFFRVPLGAEMCGPCFTPDDTTLFVAVQHPATDGVKNYPGFERNSTFEDPATRWPDFKDAMPPRPSVVAITKQGGGEIGS